MPFLILVLLVSVVQATSPASRQALSNSAGSAQNIQHKGNANQNAAAKSAPVKPSPASTEGQNTGDRPANADAQRIVVIRELPPVTVNAGPDLWNRAYVLLTAALVIIGAFGVCYARRSLLAIESQLRAMRRQVAEMVAQRGVMQGQLAQMESAGQQTERMIETSSKQAGLMEKSGTHTQELAQQAVAQTKLTQTQLELSNRPWISIDAITPISNLVFDQRGCVIMLGTQLRNVGRSVAKHVSIFIDVIVGGVHNPIEIKEKVIAIQKKPIDSSFDHGKLIFPNQIVTDQYPIIISPEVVQKALDEGHFKDSKQITFELFACADYQSTFDPERHHQTHGMYLVGRIERQRGVLMGTFSPAQPSYDIKDLAINYKGIGAYAD